MRKYVAQQTYDNFVYPNNNVAVYDNDGIVQNIPTSGITGTVSGFTASKVGTTITVSFNYTWTRNGSDVFRTNSDRINLFSVHMMTPDKTYYKPWRLFDVKYVTGTTQNTYAGSYTASVTQAEFGETYGSGVYSFEIRFIGGLNTYVVCQTASIVAPTGTPTPTPTRTVTPTPTPTSGTPTPTPTQTITPTTSSPPVYRTIQLSNPPGVSSTSAACSIGSGLTYYINYASAISSGLVIYTNPSLTTRLYNSDPLADGYYVMLFDNNSGIRYAVDFDSLGDVNSVTSC